MRKTLSAVATLLFLLAAPTTVLGQGIFIGVE
jgi:hypothetical protein